MHGVSKKVYVLLRKFRLRYLNINFKLLNFEYGIYEIINSIFENFTIVDVYKF